MRTAITVVLLLAIGFIAYSAGCLTAERKGSNDMRGRRIAQSPNYNGSAFFNRDVNSISRPGTMGRSLRLWINGTEKRHPGKKLGPFAADTNWDTRPSAGLRVCWLGHSTSIIEIDGARFLIDPIWSKRSSPVGFAGPQRFFDPPLPLGNLPRLDAIIISHDHYDHLDETTIRILARLGVPFYTALGVGAHLEKFGVPPSQIREFDWWERITIGGGITIVATPAQHFSGRGVLDRNSTLWASWCIIGKKHRLFYSGDTGYFPGLAAIGDRYGPFDLTLLEIGAFHENWGMIHLGPANALRAHTALKGRLLMPVHWGTFQLAFHDWFEPIETLLRLASPSVRLLVPEPGRIYSIADGAVNSRWWEQYR